MVDYFATLDQFDDGDGVEFHMDVANFTSNATQFGAEAVANFTSNNSNYIVADSDLSDNILHSSSITALYGAMVTDQLRWTNTSHHVIVWVGVTAPRDPNYAQSYSVSPSVYSTFVHGAAAMSPGCEPAYTFAANVTSPRCVGWTNTSSANSTTSLATLAQNATNCATSLGGQCTIDTIDLWATPTDPMSKGWPTGRSGGGPGGATVVQNTNRVLRAGCDLANATGGSWDGPSFYTCPNGANGTLKFGGAGTSNFTNPTLDAALANVSLGVGSSGAMPVPGHSMFSFVPFGPVQLAPSLDAAVHCTLSNGTAFACDAAAIVPTPSGVPSLAWNWSGGLGLMPTRSSWSASFNVIVGGIPSGRTIPVDACTSIACVAAEGVVSGPTSGLAYAIPHGETVRASFPLVNITVAGPNPLSVQLQVAPTNPLVGATVTALATPSGGWGALSYAWTFGDGSSAAGVSATHAYLRPGSFVIHLAGHDALGQWANGSTSLTVGDAPLTASLTLAPSETTVGRSISFTGASVGGSTPIAYAWADLPLGCYSTDAPTLTCTPWSAGTFPVTLSSTDVFGRSADATISLLVNPALQVNVSEATGALSCASNLEATELTATVHGGTPAFAYAWTFGPERTTAVGSSVSMGFAPGTSHTAILEVTDAAGATGNGTLVFYLPTSTCGGSNAPNFVASTSGMVLLALGAVAIVGVAVVVLARRHR
ncbi:MAG: PKD domain-containing protein [Thermoplasmata archaeon]